MSTVIKQEPMDERNVHAIACRLLVNYSVGRLYLCANGRVGLNGHEFHCGECFEVFAPVYGTEIARWREVRIEHSEDWYLVGDARQGDELLGLVARRHL